MILLSYLVAVELLAEEPVQESTLPYVPVLRDKGAGQITGTFKLVNLCLRVISGGAPQIFVILSLKWHSNCYGQACYLPS